MKISKAFLLVFCSTFLLSFSTHAQVQTVRDSLIKAYEQGSIMLQNGRYVINRESFKIGFMQRNIGETLKKSPLAYTEFELFKKTQNKALGFYFAGLGVALAGVLIRNNSNAESNKALAGGLVIGGLTSTIISLPIMAKSTKHFHKSVWLYNRDVLNN
jgi:hypothetical protein